MMQPEPEQYNWAIVNNKNKQTFREKKERKFDGKEDSDPKSAVGSPNSPSFCRYFISKHIKLFLEYIQ